MLERPLFRLVADAIEAQLAVRGAPAGTLVVKSYQPQMQGIPSGPFIALHLVSDRRYGSMKREERYNRDAGVMEHFETQYRETVYQVDALRKLDPQNPADVDAITASDLVQITAAILQSDAGQATLRAAGVGILRITDIRQAFIVDPESQSENSPSFDFTLTHKDYFNTTAPVAETFETRIVRV